MSRPGNVPVINVHLDADCDSAIALDLLTNSAATPTPEGKDSPLQAGGRWVAKCSDSWYYHDVKNRRSGNEGQCVHVIDALIALEDAVIMTRQLSERLDHSPMGYQTQPGP